MFTVYYFHSNCVGVSVTVSVAAFCAFFLFLFFLLVLSFCINVAHLTGMNLVF